MNEIIVHQYIKKIDIINKFASMNSHKKERKICSRVYL